MQRPEMRPLYVFPHILTELFEGQIKTTVLDWNERIIKQSKTPKGEFQANGSMK